MSGGSGTVGPPGRPAVGCHHRSEVARPGKRAGKACDRGERLAPRTLPTSGCNRKLSNIMCPPGEGQTKDATGGAFEGSAVARVGARLSPTTLNAWSSRNSASVETNRWNLTKSACAAAGSAVRGTIREPSPSAWPCPHAGDRRRPGGFDCRVGSSDPRDPPTLWRGSGSARLRGSVRSGSTGGRSTPRRRIFRPMTSCSDAWGRGTSWCWRSSRPATSRIGDSSASSSPPNRP
jgi:hypothetical protein